MTDIVLLLVVRDDFECGSRGLGVLEARGDSVGACGWVLNRLGGSDRCWGHIMSSE